MQNYDGVQHQCETETEIFQKKKRRKPIIFQANWYVKGYPHDISTAKERRVEFKNEPSDE